MGFFGKRLRKKYEFFKIRCAKYRAMRSRRMTMGRIVSVDCFVSFCFFLDCFADARNDGWGGKENKTRRWFATPRFNIILLKNY